jgi:hypothetical protein
MNLSLASALFLPAKYANHREKGKEKLASTAQDVDRWFHQSIQTTGRKCFVTTKSSGTSCDPMALVMGFSEAIRRPPWRICN